MRRLSFVAAVACASLAVPAGAETLTNEQVIRLSAAGLGDQVLIAKIRASDNAFDTSTEGLLALRRKGVPNAVIAEMIAAGSREGKAAALRTSASADPAPAAFAPDSPDPAAPHPPGIYLLVDWRSPTAMVALPPVDSRRTKSGNLFAYWLTGGIARRSRKAVIPEQQARVETLRRRPVFYFYFGRPGAGDAAGGLLEVRDRAASPDDFALVRFAVKDKGREAKVGSSGRFGSSGGVPEKDRIAFVSTRLSPGVYSVQPEEDLADGEYGFVSPLPASGNAEERVRVFDFSVGGKRRGFSK
ncbi:MAG: hypothetical protein J7496_04190 [Novosphingobium sp.]|nr:hypothetical protein [Novosphingobium sp.]MBO9601692.1 hypothetical protein [Novosphingobium sp.]